MVTLGEETKPKTKQNNKDNPNKTKKNFLSYEVDEKHIVENVLTFDLESHEWINFVVLGFYDLDKNHYMYFDSMKEALDYMYNYCKTRNLKDIYGHFAGKFDFNFVLDSAYNDFTDYTFTRGIPRGSGFLSMTIKRFRDENEAEGDFELTFHDSSALFPMGLGKLAKMMGVETQKGSVDFKYLLAAWNNEDYKNELLEATYTDEHNNEVIRHKVFVCGEPVTDKRLLRISHSSDVTYHCIETKTDYKIYNRDDILLYLRGDCVSLAESIRKFYELPFIAKAKKAKTIAGQAVNVLKTYLPPDIENYIPKSKNQENDFNRMGYFGGRTEIFKHFFDNNYDVKKNPYNLNYLGIEEMLFQVNKTLKCYDVNSLYPTVMRNTFPLTCVGKVRGKTNYDKYNWGMWKVKVQVPLDAEFPFLGIQHTAENGTAKYCFPVGEFVGYWTKEELEYAKTLGYKIVKYYEGMVYSSAAKIFETFIDEMYAMRLAASNAGDEATKGIVKLIMNSSYGKIGMRVDDKVFIRESGLEDLGNNKPIGQISSKRGLVLLEEVKSDTKNIFHKVIIPAYVTAYARILMHKLMLQCGARNVYYTDTDSIFTTETMPTGDGLGALKLEYESNSAVFLMPKTYSIDDILNADYASKITMKGFDRRKVQSFSHKDLLDFKFGEIAALKAYDPEKFLTMKSAFQKNTFLGMNRSLKDEERRYNEQMELFLIQQDLCREAGDVVLMGMLDIRIKKLKERYEKKKPVNYKEIKSKYDKRIAHEDGINTTPITLGVMDGKFESEYEKTSGSVKSGTKYGPSFEDDDGD